MSTFYLDYEGGNDANDGLSFANRWKTVNNGATSARIAPGDVIRIMASPDPTDTGINGTFTNLSPNITLSSALNALVTNCDAAWTASPNVTTSANTVTYRTATGSASFAFAGAFTTGLAAYLALGGAQDYSAYQGLTFWVRTNTTLAASTLSLRLCSDAAGVTTVDTFAIPALPVANAWVPVYVDTGGALGASIQSIALYADADPGTATVLLDNISTVKAAGVDNLNLASLVGKNTTGEYWWAIRSINGTAVVLDNGPSSTSSATPKGYVGTTETVDLYKRETTKTTMTSASSQPIQDSGTSGNNITFSCGWNRTDMSTQTGVTYFDGQGGVGTGLDFNLNTFITVDKFYAVRYSTGLLCGPADCTIGEAGAVACSTLGLSVGTAASRLSATSISVLQGPTGGASLTGPAFRCDNLEVYGVGETAGSVVVLYGRGIKIEVLRIKNGASTALSLAQFPANNLYIGTLEIANIATGINQLTTIQDFRIKSASFNTVSGVAYTSFGGVNYRVDSLTHTSCGTALSLPAGFTASEMIIGSWTTTGNTTVLSATTFTGVLKVLASSFGEASPLSFSGSDYTSGRIIFQNFDGTSNDHRTYYSTGTNGATVFADSTTRHSSSGLSWKFNIQSTTFINSNFPVTFPVARIAVNANKQVTASLWCRRSSTSMNGTFRCRSGQIAGVTVDVEDSISAAIDTWQQLNLVFTPTEVGVIDLDFYCSGVTSQDLFIHDFTVTQAV